MRHFCSENIIDAAGVADLLGVSQRRVHQLDRVLKPRRFGRTRIYDVAAIERYAGARDAQRSRGRS